VLVVDDHADARDSLAIVLRLWGHEVETAPDGPAALAVAPAFRPHVVVLDIGMPGMDGYELARRLRQLVGDDDMLLMACSGYGRAEDIARAKDAGCDHHLLKPYDLDLLESFLAKHAAAVRPS
jgi:CheY-like chemotaxis protein